MKILVAEDNEDSRLLVLDILNMMGHEAAGAKNGQQALSLAQEETPDLIILDVNMPIMSGFEALEHIKADVKLADIPVLMLTAQSGIDDRVQGLGLGADDYITKPFSPRELMARVDARLRAKQASDDLRAARDHILNTFERYVAPSVVEKLVADPTSVQLGGQLQEVTAFFADLEGFTGLSENTEPAQLLDILNGYLSVVTEAIISNEGTLDKFLGDGVMALFNTPLQIPNHALAAVQAAMDAQIRVEAYHQSLDPKFHLKFRIGIHTGHAIVGNVGAAQIHDYTAIGDTINTAARIEQSGQGGQVLISETTYELVKEAVIAEQLGARQVRGRSEPVVVYQIGGLRI